MKLGRWSLAVSGLAGAMALVCLPVLAQTQDEFKPEWKAFNKGQVWYQKLETKTDQTMKVMGQEVKQKQNQTFYLQYTGQEPKDGNLVVQQKIIGIKMSIDIGGVNIAYDSTDEKQPANPMTDFFKKLLEADLKLTINPKTMEVVSVEDNDLVKKLGDTNPQMAPLLQKILSKEALKQMAEPTWGAFPVGGAKKGTPWEKKSKLDLGPIGTYDTTYKYTYEGTDKLGEKVKVDASLSYSPPGANEKSGLPFIIKSAKLSSKSGSGAAYFDKDAGRFSRSEMKMVLEGTLEIDVGGMVTAVELLQDQTATVDSMKDNPIAAAPAKK